MGQGVLAWDGICAAVARGGGGWVTFLYKNVDVGVASRMLINMTGINRTGESNAFLRVFSCVGMAAALMRGHGVERASMWMVDGMFRGDLR